MQNSRTYGILWPVLRVTVFPEDILKDMCDLSGEKGVKRDVVGFNNKRGMLLLMLFMATILGRQVGSMALCTRCRNCSIARDAVHKQQSAVPCWLGCLSQL